MARVARRAYRPVFRRTAVGVAIVGLVALGGMALPQADAAVATSVTIVEAGQSDAVSIGAVTFATARTALETGDPRVIGLNIGSLPQLDLGTSVAVDVIEVDGAGSIAITGTAEDVSLGNLGTTDVEVLVLGKWADMTTKAPQIVLGLQVSGTVTLATVLGDTSGGITADIQLPKLAILAGTEETTTAVKLKDIPQDAVDWFDDLYGLTVPDSLTLPGNVTLVGSFALDPLGDEVQSLLGYVDGSHVVLDGSLGVSFPDFTTGMEIDDPWGLTARRPATQLPEAARLLLGVETAVDWTFDVTYDPTAQKVKSVVSAHVETPIFGDQPQTLDVAGTLEVAEKDGKRTLSLKLVASTGGWVGALGIDWLDLDEVKITIAYTEELTKDKDGKEVATRVLTAKLTAKVIIAGKEVEATLAGTLSKTPDASVTLALNTPVSLGELADAIGLSEAFSFLPAEALAPLRSMTIDDATIGLRVKWTDDDTVLQFTATAGMSITIGQDPGLTLSGRFLLVVDEEGRLTVGLRPAGTITMGDMLSVVDLAMPEGLPDFPIIGGAKTGPFFGFVVTTHAIESTASNLLTTAEAEFYRPFFGGGANFTLELPKGVTALGTFPMPYPINEFLKNTIGMSPIITASGTFPIFGGGDLALELKLTVDPDGLPYFIDARSKLFIKATASLTSPTMKLAIGGDLRVRFKAGLPQEVADLLALDGLPIQVAAPVPLDEQGNECPNGNKPEPIVEGEGIDQITNYYCIDHLSGSIEGALTIDATSVSVSVTPMFKSTPVGSTWYPFGQPWIGVSQMGATLTLGWAEGLVSIKGGFVVNASVALGDANTNALVAMEIGFKPLPAPPFVVIDFGGIRLASADGVEFLELVGIAEDLAQVVDPNAKIPTDALPNIAMRNLDFQFSPQPGGVPTLCIQEGLFVSGDFYTDLNGVPPAKPPQCVNNESIIEDEDDKCSNRKDEGCFFSGALDISTSGLEAFFDISPFDLGPIHIGYDPTGSSPGGVGVEIAATLADQHFSLQGGVSIDDVLQPGKTLADGDLKISLRPTSFDFYGRLDIFSYTVLADGNADLALLTSDSPNLRMHVLLGSDQARLGKDDFGMVVQRAISLPLDALIGSFRVFDALLTASPTDPLAALQELPDILRREGIPIDPVFEALVDGVIGAIQKFDFLGLLDFDWILNGKTFNFLLFSVKIPGLCPVLPSSFKEDGKCTVASVFYGVLDPVLDGILGFSGSGADTVKEKIREFPLVSEPTFTMECVEFELDLNAQQQTTALSVNATLLGDPIGFNFGWDFNPAAFDDNVVTLVDQVIQVLAGNAPQQCEGLNEALFAAAPVRTSPLLETEIDPVVVNEGSQITLTGSFGVDLPAPHTVSIDWGDGIVEDVTAAAGVESFTATHIYADDDPTRTRRDVVTVIATDVTDDVATAQNVTINNVPPTVDGLTLAPASVIEGDDAVLTVAFHDSGLLDTHTVAVNWGDNYVSDHEVPVGSHSVTVTHTYRDDHPTATPEDTYPIRVTVTDDDLGSTTGSVVVTVIDAAPVVEAGRDVATDEGTEVTVSAAYTDSGILDWHTATADWGDGTPPDTFILDSLDGAGTFEGTHVYADNGTYEVTFEVTDDDTLIGTDTVRIDVANVLPTIEAGIDQMVYEERVLALDPALLHDQGTLDTHTATIDWGDGSPIESGTVTESPFGPPGSTTGADGSIDASHVYHTPRDYTVTVCVYDDDSPTRVCDSFEVRVVPDFELIRAALEDMRETLSSLRANVTLRYSILEVGRLLDPHLWVARDELARYGFNHFNSSHREVRLLRMIGFVDRSVADAMNDHIVGLFEGDRALAEFEIIRAEEAGHDMTVAWAQISNGEADFAAHQADKAIRHFRDAWIMAHRALQT